MKGTWCLELEAPQLNGKLGTVAGNVDGATGGSRRPLLPFFFVRVGTLRVHVPK